MNPEAFFILSMANFRDISKRVILDELQENQHPEFVEDVIFWALKYYADGIKEVNGSIDLSKVVAAAIVARIEEEEDNYRANNN